MSNRQWVLESRPLGFPMESDFKLVEAELPTLGEGAVLLRALYLSVDPYMRGRISSARSYAKPVGIGEVMVGGGVAEVVDSMSPEWKKGDIAEVYMGWQEYTVVSAKHLRRLDPAVAPVSTALGVLGMPGLTAYFGLLHICDPKHGETVVVSGAAGAVGSAVGQIAKLKGCRTVGVAGGEHKISYITSECGYDAGLDYKSVEPHEYGGKLRELCPNGVDIYFDNVGGPLTDAVLLQLNTHARVAICGQISQYNNEKPEMGPRLLGMLIVARAKMQGFLVTDFAAKNPAALAELTAWVREGKLKYRESIVEGFEKLPKAFIGMLKGENIGKQLVRVG